MSNTDEVKAQLDAADREAKKDYDIRRLIAEVERSGARHAEFKMPPPELPTGTTGHAGRRTETPAEQEARIRRSSSAALKLVLTMLLLIGLALAGGLYGGWLIHDSSARDFEKALTDAHSRCKEQGGNWRESLEYFSCEVDQKAGTE